MYVLEVLVKCHNQCSSEILRGEQSSRIDRSWEYLPLDVTLVVLVFKCLSRSFSLHSGKLMETLLFLRLHLVFHNFILITVYIWVVNNRCLTIISVISELSDTFHLIFQKLLQESKHFNRNHRIGCQRLFNSIIYLR